LSGFAAPNDDFLRGEVMKEEEEDEWQNKNKKKESKERDRNVPCRR